MNTKVRSLPLTIFSSILPISIVTKHEMTGTRRLNDAARKSEIVSSSILNGMVCIGCPQVRPQPYRQRNSKPICLRNRSKQVHYWCARFDLCPINSAYNPPHGSGIHRPLCSGHTLALISITQA